MYPALPKVSVVTVVKNAAEALEETILSVISQDYKNVEYIVVDGDSSDATPSVIQAYSPHLARWVSEADRGIYDAMNKGADLASGEWIIYMNAGDRFYSPTALSQLTPELTSNADVIFAGVVEVLVDELQTRTYRKTPRPLKNLWYQMPTSHQATLVRLRHQRTYQFNTDYRWCADHDLLLRLYRDGKQLVATDIPLAIFDCSSSGSHRQPLNYIRERWYLSRGAAPLVQRVGRYGYEWLHCTIWGKVVNFTKQILPDATILYLRQIRGTGGDLID